MATLYSGVHLKLKSTKTTWQDKLKIAHFAWISQQCFLPNKEQVLLDWVCHALVRYHSRKLELEGDVVEKLWTFFDSILHSKKLQNLLKNGKTFNLRFPVAQVINDKIYESSTLNGQKNICTVLSCCQAILSNPAHAIIYNAKCELLVELLSRLSLVACQQLASGESLTPQVFDILHLTFCLYLQIQRQQVNAIRVFGHMIDHLLQRCLLLRYLLSSRAWVKEDDTRIHHQLSKEIRSKAEAVLQTGLFQAEILPYYKEELLSGTEPQEKRGSLKALMPVQALLSKLCYSSSSEESFNLTVVANSLPMLYKLFLDSYCKDGNQLLCFHMVTKFFESLQITPLCESLSSNWSVTLLAVEQILNLLLDNGIYNVAIDRIRQKEIQFKFFRTVAELLLNNSQPSIPSWFRCLRTLLLLNHLILEPDLDDLVSSAWIDADISDVRVKKAQEVLISSLFQTYTKLRQVTRLFEEVLSVICRPAAEELRSLVLPSGLALKLCECLLELPPNQILDIWELILGKCCILIIPDIRDDSDMALKLLSISSLLHSIMFNMRTSDNTTPVPVIHRTQKLMWRTLQELIRPLLNLPLGQFVNEPSPVWLEKAIDSALLLTHTWVEVNTMLSLNCSKYVSAVGGQSTSVSFPIESWDFSVLLPDVGCWKTVVKTACHFNSLSKYCLELLSLQKIKKLLLVTDVQSDAFIQSLQNAASFVLCSGNPSLSEVENELWNGVASSVNNNTYPIAHWHLIVSHLPVFVSYVSADELNSVAEMLLKTLQSIQLPTESENHNQYLSLEKVFSSLLHSGFYIEIIGLHSAIITCLIRQCACIVYCDEQNIFDCVLGQLLTGTMVSQNESTLSSEGVKAEMETVCMKPLKQVASVCWESLERFSQNLMFTAEADSLICLEEDQLEPLCRLLGTISSLKPDTLISVDHTRCFLFLLFVILRVRGCSNCSMSKTLKLQKTCYHHLACLQSGLHADSVLMTMHASDILEVLLESLFAVSKDFSDSEYVYEWVDLLLTMQHFLELFIQMIIKRKQSLLINLEKIAFYLANCRPYSNAISNKPSRHWSPQAGHILLVAQSTLCRVTIEYLQEHTEKDPTSEGLSTLLQKTIQQMGTVVQLTLRGTTSHPLMPPFFVTCVTTLLKAEITLTSYCSHRNGQSNPKLSMLCNDMALLQHPELYRVFCSQIIKTLCSTEDHVQFVKSALEFLTFYCSVPLHQPETKSTVLSIFISVQKLLAGPWMTAQIIKSLQPEMTCLLDQLLKTCSLEEFYVIIKLVLQGTEINNLWKQKDKEVLAAITIMNLLLRVQIQRDRSMFFWSTVPQIMTSLGLLMRETSKDQCLVPVLVVPILELVAILLMKGEGAIQNVHHVTMAFGILSTVPLDHLRREDYYSVFLGSHEVLFSILQYHPMAMLKAVPSFLNNFHRLLASVMHEGRQKGEKGTSPNFADILKCAQLVERMYTHIAAKTEEFTVFSVFLVSLYVNELQKVTLCPPIKKHLSEGIYHILDICIERDIKFLNSSLDMGVREVFKELYSDYTHYHKLKNQGEKKYTA